MFIDVVEFPPKTWASESISKPNSRNVLNISEMPLDC